MKENVSGCFFLNTVLLILIFDTVFREWSNNEYQRSREESMALFYNWRKRYAEMSSPTYIQGGPN